MKIEAITGLAEIKRLQHCWEQWQTHPNSDFAHFELVCELRRDSQTPIVFYASENDQPRALMVGRVGPTILSPRIGYFAPLKISARVIDMVYQGELGDPDPRIAAQMIAHLESLLADKSAEAAVFHNLPDNSTLLPAVQARESRFWFETPPMRKTHWSMSLAPDSDFFSAKVRSKHRSWLRKKQKALEAAFPGGVCWEWLSSFSDVASLCSKLERVASKTYQRALEAGFVDDEEHRQRYSLFAKRGQLRVQLLTIDGQPKAFWTGVVYRNVFHSFETGYDPLMRDFEIGTLIFARMYDNLVREGIPLFDFGLGDANYKQRFGDNQWHETTVRLFAPTPRGALVHLALALSDRLDQIGRRIVDHFGVTDRLKTQWRRRISGEDGSAS